MANFDTIKTAIDANIKTNGTQDITGGKMNSILKQMVDATDEQLTELESVVGNADEIASANNNNIINTGQCIVYQTFKEDGQISIKIVDENNVIKTARLRLWDENNVQSWESIEKTNEWIIKAIPKGTKAYSVYASETTGNEGAITILKRGFLIAKSEEVDENKSNIKSLYDGLGFKELPLLLTPGAYYGLNDNNDVVLNDNDGYVASEVEIESGLYCIYAWARNWASIIIKGQSGKTYFNYNQAESANNQWAYLPENKGTLYISSQKGVIPKLWKVVDDKLMSLIQDSQKVEVITESSFISGGYYQGQSVVPISGSGIYKGAIDISEYKNIDIIFPEINNASWRESFITDENGNTTQLAYEKGLKSIHFDIHFGDKYLYCSTTHKTCMILLGCDKTNDRYNPLSGLYDRPTFHTSIFNKITCVGDSLTEGVFNTTGNDIVDKRYSYPTFLEKQTGVETKNLGIGSTCASRADDNHSWMDVANGRNYFISDNIGDAAIIALGTNDISRFGGFTGDVSTDIGNTIESCANTSVGGYAAIILKLKELNPRIKIFCVTISNNRNTEEERIPANEKIRQIAKHFGALVIDLEKWAETTPEEQSLFSTKYKNGSHNNALGYNLRAKQYAVAISYLIEHNWRLFQDVQFIGTDYEYDSNV